MNPKEALQVWDAFKTGTGVAAWLGAVACLILAIALVLTGNMSLMDAGLFAFGIVTWAITKLRGRYATLKLQATTDAVFAQNQQLLAMTQTPTKK